MSTEVPECPVCLQVYASTETVPRVLPCGHTACGDCIDLLPSVPAHPDAVRCPVCIHLFLLHRPIGSKSLPKNIELLRFSNPDPNPIPKPSKPKPDPPSSSPSFLPLPWTQTLLDSWNNWILPQDFLEITKIDTDTDTDTAEQRLLFGNRIASRGGENKRVSLYPIGVSSTESKCFRFSHTARTMEAVCRLEERVRDQLEFLLESCSRQRRGVCAVFGLWMKSDEETSRPFLVCEKFERSLSDMLVEDGKWREGLRSAESFGFGMIGMELCEVVMSLHSKSIVVGCLGLDCFCMDEYGHCLLDFNAVLLRANRIWREARGGSSDAVNTREFVSPEVFLSVYEGSAALSYDSDVWSLGCILVMILIGDAELAGGMFDCLLPRRKDGNLAEAVLGQYEIWKDKVLSRLQVLLSGTKCESLLGVLASCLDYHPENRPQVRDIWCCIRNHFFETSPDDVAIKEKESQEYMICCLLLGKINSNHRETSGVSAQEGNGCLSENVSENGLAGTSGSSVDHSQEEKLDIDLVNGLQGGALKFDALQGHRDCITGLAVGGGYLFSSSFDKTVNVWSLQDFSHVLSLRGHEHRIMAMVVVDEVQPLCISGDSGSVIFVWRIGTSCRQELLKEWHEHNNWCYSGVHALATSGGYLYSGSGDKSIKVWSLQDYSLVCSMTGHNSTVSSLVVGNGVLYSGSWDGNIRLWCLSDHSLLSVLGDDSSSLPPILSLSVDHRLLVSAHENGCIKVWKDDSFVRSMQVQDGAIFAVHVDTKWLFTGGWNKFVNIQEFSESELKTDIRPVGSISCDAVITSILYSYGKLFVGFSNKEIKVYYHEK